MKLNYIMIAMLIVLVNMSLVSAAEQSLGVFNANSDIVLRQLCSNCTYNNITSVTYKSETLVSNISMTNLGTEYVFLLNGGNTSRNGEYIVNGFGDLNGEITIWAYSFEITPNGTNISTSQSLVYFILILIFGITLFVLLHQMFKVNSFAWKVSYFNISYLLFVSISFFAWKAANDFLFDVPIVANVLYYVWFIGLLLLLPLILISFGLLVESAMLDTKKQKLLNLGYGTTEVKQRFGK